MTTTRKQDRLIISEQALSLYSQMRTLRCCCPPPPPDAEYWNVPDDCPPCEAWASLNRELARLIRLPVHEVHCTVPPHGECFLPEVEQARTDMFEQALAEREGRPS
jgi:hypothetical protein